MTLTPQVFDDPVEAARTPRLEFVLTSGAEQRGGGAAGGGAGGAAGGGVSNDEGGGEGGVGAEGGGGVEREEREAREVLLRSTSVRLNGLLLAVDSEGALPRLRPVRTRGAAIVARPLSVSFYVFPEAGVKGCMTEKQADTRTLCLLYVGRN